MGQNRAQPAITAYQNAIANLPKSDLTPTQKKQKKQYEDGLLEAEEVMRPKKVDVVYVSKDEIKDTPWERGLDTLKTLGMRPVPTSAWVIGKACEDWQLGLKNLQQLKEIEFPDGRKAWGGSLEVISSLTNAVLRDRRVFHAGENWFEMMEKQSIFETDFCDGWHGVGPKIVLKEAIDRVMKDGWEGTPDESGVPKGGTRKAVSTQVRYVLGPRPTCCTGTLS